MFFEAPKSDISAVSVHGVSLDVVNGFIEILEEDLTPGIHATLKTLGFKVAESEKVSAAVTEVGAAELLKNEAAERAALIEEIKSWGHRIDGRKGLAWLKERYEEFVAQGLIKPGEKPGSAPASGGPEPVIPLSGAAAADPLPVFQDDPAAVTEGSVADASKESTGAA